MDRRIKSVKLALQGGGSHGAFTWGVLDQLLDDERLQIAAISGTSAGAMNAVAVVDGMNSGGPAKRANAWKASGRPPAWQLVSARSAARRST